MFEKPTAIDCVTGLLGASGANIHSLVPAEKNIPKEFSRDGNPYAELARHWFYRGLDRPLTPKPHIDRGAAERHLSAVLRSWDLSHEHKMAATAYLMSLWFEPQFDKPPRPSKQKKARPKRTPKPEVTLGQKKHQGPLRGGLGNKPTSPLFRSGK